MMDASRPCMACTESTGQSCTRTMSSMNPYPSYEYVFQMNSLNSPYPTLKMDDPYLESDLDRDETAQCSLPYMGTFSKHSPPGVMFYNQLPYEHIHPLLMHQRRRPSPDLEGDIEPPINYFATNNEHKDWHRPEKKVQQKRRSEDDPFGVSIVEDGSAEVPSKARKSFFCRSCGKTFKFQTSLLRHNNKVHISKYQCPTCSRVFSRQAYLDVHTSKQGSSCFIEPTEKVPRPRMSICASQE